MLLDHVIVSRKSHRSDRAYDIIMSNVSVVNYLFDEGANGDELCDEALGSYHVDFYEVQVSNGGIDQFVHNSGWDPFVIGHVSKGLELMGAPPGTRSCSPGSSRSWTRCPTRSGPRSGTTACSATTG